MNQNHSPQPGSPEPVDTRDHALAMFRRAFAALLDAPPEAPEPQEA